MYNPLPKVLRRKQPITINTSHLNLMGYPAMDKVTGFKGVITMVAYDLYGCIQAVITPPSSTTEIYSGNWFDVTRIELTSDTPVMDAPDFSKSVDQDFSMLGKRVKDKITGFEGVVTSLGFDLYKGVDYAVTPPSSETDVYCGGWINPLRVETLSETPVMEIPNFNKGYVSEGRKGAASKPPL